jgi:hypothetical protein
VPYDDWFRALTGRTLSSLTGAERNHYDRLVHFSYGLLLAYPAREVFLRVADVRGFWGYYLPLDVVMATSMLYELIEWGAASAFGGDLGTAYLGTQGDPWDAQKDMALATLGAIIAMVVTAAVNWHFQKDFARSWAESLRVKRHEPLGEDELAADRERPSESVDQPVAATARGSLRAARRDSRTPSRRRRPGRARACGGRADSSDGASTGSSRPASGRGGWSAGRSPSEVEERRFVGLRLAQAAACTGACPSPSCGSGRRQT